MIEISGPWLLLGLAETRLNSSTAGLLIAMVPLIAVAALALTGGERVSARRMVGLLIGFGGVLVLVGLDLDFADLAAVGALVLTAVGYAAGPILISRSFTDIPATGVITASLLLAALLYSPFLPAAWPDRIPLDARLSVVGLAVVCTGIGFLVFFALIAESGPARATVITYVNPAVAIALGVLIRQRAVHGRHGDRIPAGDCRFDSGDFAESDSRPNIAAARRKDSGDARSGRRRRRSKTAFTRRVTCRPNRAAGTPR